MYDETKAETPTTNSAVSEWLTNLGREIGSTKEALTALKKNLGPVLRQKHKPPAKDGPSPPQQPLVPVAGALRTACEQLRRITDDANTTRSMLGV